MLINCLEVKNLTKLFAQNRKKKKIIAVNNLSFNIEHGQIFGLLGPNGAGKTTIIKVICGLTRPDSGQILIEGYDNFKEKKDALKKISVSLEGNRNIYWQLTPSENLEFFAKINGNFKQNLSYKINELLSIFNLKDKKNIPVRKLSQGMKRKVEIAACLISDPSLILLDEPTLGLDVMSSYSIREYLKYLVREEGKTILLTSHDMNIVEDLCENVLILKQGKKIAVGKTDEFISYFHTSFYDIIVQNLEENQEKDLKNISFVNINKKSNQVSISFDSNDSRKTYKVFDILKRENTKIKDINHEKANFEKVFLNILKEKDNKVKGEGVF